MEYRDLANAVLMKAIEDATRETVEYGSSVYPSKTEKAKAIRFLLGLGEYAIWLKFWCNVAGIKVSSVKKYAETLQGGKNGERTKIYDRM